MASCLPPLHLVGINPRDRKAQKKEDVVCRGPEVQRWSAHAGHVRQEGVESDDMSMSTT